VTTPKFEVRSFSYDRRARKADLNYAPCKGQMVLVIAGKEGILLSRKGSRSKWSLPNGRIGAAEEPLKAAKRIAAEQAGMSVRSLELAGMYDIIWHFSDISIKRLHLVYAATTDDERFSTELMDEGVEARFFAEVPESLLKDDIASSALADCSEK
jgi:ADP-ribose pyrophosphatase YjhB (NUDIX family)